MKITANIPAIGLICLAGLAQAGGTDLPPEVATRMEQMLETCAAAETCDTRAAITYCGEAISAGGAPSEWARCQAQELRFWDRKLNAVYKLRLAEQKEYDTGTGEAQFETRLRQMQRSWIPFRDAACDYAAHGRPSGSGAINDVFDCLIAKTRDQISFIENPLQ